MKSFTFSELKIKLPKKLDELLEINTDISLNRKGVTTTHRNLKMNQFIDELNQLIIDLPAILNRDLEIKSQNQNNKNESFLDAMRSLSANKNISQV